MGQERSKTDLISRLLRPLQRISFLSVAVTAAAALDFTPTNSSIPDSRSQLPQLPAKY
jgi:hypothetical protein